MAKQTDENNKPWMIRDVSERTRRNVKVFAVERNITIAEALEQIVDAGLYTLYQAAPRTASTDAPESISAAPEKFGRIGEMYLERLARRKAEIDKRAESAEQEGRLVGPSED